MNQRMAFKETIAYATRNYMPMDNDVDDSLSLRHIIDMDARLDEHPEYSDAKIGRWLGWAQCAVVASGTGSLEEMKQINMRWADDG